MNRPEPTLETELLALDTETVSAQRIAQHMLANEPLGIPPIPLSRAERRVLPAVQRDLGKLEHALAERYGRDFDNVGWHGRSSQQRIMWQHEGFFELMRKPLATKAILARARSRRELKLGGGNTLSSMLLAGLAVNRPSYLLTASPNWHSKPQVRGVGWGRLSDMAAPSSAAETPRAIDSTFLQRASAALPAIQQALAEITPRAPAPAASGRLWKAIDQASGERMIKAIMSLLDERRATLVVRGEAGDSTALERMSGQCLEVMSEYPDLLDAHGGRHDLVLGYGLVSHALDAKHLAAALIHGIKLGRQTYRLVRDGVALDNLKRLLDGAAGGALGSPATELMRARLRQVLRLMADGGRKLSLPAAEIIDALRA